MVRVKSVFKVMMGEVDGRRSVRGGKWLVDVVRGGRGVGGSSESFEREPKSSARVDRPCYYT